MSFGNKILEQYTLRSYRIKISFCPKKYIVIHKG